MTDRSDRRRRISVSISAADLLAIDSARGDTPRSRYLASAALREPGSLEAAVARVVGWLDDHGRYDLAAAVAIATHQLTASEQRSLTHAILRVIDSCSSIEGC